MILLAGLSSGAGFAAEKEAFRLNDVHSRLNPAAPAEFHEPQSTEDLAALIIKAKEKGLAVSISGGRHAMGGQQFADGSLHLSMARMNDVLAFDRERGIVRVEAGIEWPRLLEFLLREQEGDPKPWAIIQKQTGADRLSVGGALSSNAHGRGLKFKPMIQDVESFTLVNAEGEVLNVSRTENEELFGLVIGGYGLFGVIASVDLRLMPRFKVQRVVELAAVEDLPAKVAERIRDGFVYGDFQYKTDVASPEFMKKGVFACYKPVPDETPMPAKERRMSMDQWNNFLLLAHQDKEKAFEIYSHYYLSTSGQVYWSDLQQMSPYNEEYLDFLAKADPSLAGGSLMLTELYVPREKILEFIEAVTADVKKNDLNVIYGVMRLVEQDDESFLPWAKQNYVAVIFNLRVDHTAEGLEKSALDFQRLIDRALELGGSYYLTYHKWARKDQVLKAYPEFPAFLKQKLAYDPEERFQSNWYRHYTEMFAAEMEPVEAAVQLQ